MVAVGKIYLFHDHTWRSEMKSVLFFNHMGLKDYIPAIILVIGAFTETCGHKDIILKKQNLVQWPVLCGEQNWPVWSLTLVAWNLIPRLILIMTYTIKGKKIQIFRHPRHLLEILLSLEYYKCAKWSLLWSMPWTKFSVVNIY